MESARDHVREAERIAALHACGVLDTHAEESFDRIARLAAQVCACPIALVSLVDSGRQWFKARVGLDTTETPRDESFCAHAVARGETLVVQDAASDPRFHDNPLVLNSPNIRFYAGVPVHDPEHLPLGTLCVIDRVPRTLSEVQRSALASLAHEVEVQLALRQALAEALRAKNEHQQLAALIVHDMRNALTSVIGGACCLEGATDLSPRSREILSTVIDASRVLQRLTRDVLDVTRAEAQGLPVRMKRFDPRATFERLGRRLTLAATESGHGMATTVRFSDDEITSDPDLLCRMIENLAANAFKYAPPGTTVEVEVTASASGPLRVRVSDEGPGVPAADRARIFDASVRLSHVEVAPGWGFGLLLCKLVTDALHGHIEVLDNAPRGAVFVAVVPISRDVSH